MLDSRRYLKKFIDTTHIVTPSQAFIKFTASLLVALFIAFGFDYELTQNGLYTLFILVFAAGLWISEAIPAFAVALLIVALEIVLLGFNGFDFASDSDWEKYLNQWSNPLIFLFLAGFIMAIAAAKTKLDIWIAKRVLFYVGGRPKHIMTGLIGITFVLSMFISNTATAAMMMTIIAPIVMMIKDENPFKKAVLLAIIIGANLGGMCTIIGTPPNAIAVGFLGEDAPSFVGWMLLATPPALFTAFTLRYLVLKVYPSTQNYISLKNLQAVEDSSNPQTMSNKKVSLADWKKKVVIFIFLATILLWLTEPLHQIPTSVVSFLPIVSFTLFGIIEPDDIREVRWDVIILIIGGLSLGFAVTENGVDEWIAGFIQSEGISTLFMMMLFSYIVVLVSNFMSNTAATNIILPIAVAIGVGYSPEIGLLSALTVALSASFAMSLPVSTPPNAIVYSSGQLSSKTFLVLGLVAGLIGPLVVYSWLYLMSNLGVII